MECVTPVSAESDLPLSKASPSIPLWESLPPELWLAIFEAFGKSERSQCLRFLALTSRRLNMLCNRVFWRFFTLPLHFASGPRGRGLDFYAKLLLSSPERTQSIRRLTIRAKLIAPRTSEQARWLLLEFSDALREILGMMTGLKELRLFSLTSYEGDSTFAPIHLDPHLAPNTMFTPSEEDNSSISVWSILLSWLSNMGLETLETGNISFKKVVTLLKLCPSIASLNFRPPTWDNTSRTLKIPPCKFVEKVNRTHVCAPSTFDMTYIVLEACEPISSLTVGRPHNSSDLGSWYRTFPMLQIIHTTNVETAEIRSMLAGAPSLLPFLVAISEGLGTIETSNIFTTRFYRTADSVAEIFQLAPLLTTYILFWEYDQYSLEGHYWDFQKALRILESNFASIPLTRGLLRIINEYRPLSGHGWISWVFQRDASGFWSFYRVDKGKIPGVTVSQREHFYLGASTF
ncbi:hypothetical protein DL93DRAFT_2226726 [Clavulina sp. PMI_390]|nr:hypothetical protein DL93DRAFT_2226726 [Clavulina sp. PMI_390]